jgi:hypothetical protein
MDVVIRNNNDNNSYKLCCCQDGFKIDIAETFDDKTWDKDLTSKVALSALRSIERKSKFLSFITHPVVHFAVGAVAVLAATVLSAVLSTGIALPAMTLIAMKVTVAALSFFAGLGTAVSVTPFVFQNSLSISMAYKRQAVAAREYINLIKENVRNNEPFTIRV